MSPPDEDPKEDEDMGEAMANSKPETDSSETRQAPEPSSKPVSISVNDKTWRSSKLAPDHDMSLHRQKEAPVCNTESLSREALSSSELSKFCFTQNEAEAEALSTNSAEREGERNGFTALRPEVLKRTTSRVGRSNQRWEEDPDTGIGYRLSTGTVPIMSDGRILFISSSRKQEWILPKGGWEKDETEEECALRETFEEAGVIGTLGPNLSVVEYETRKAKKRRETRENAEGLLRKIDTPSSGVSVQSTSSDFNSEDDTMAPEVVSCAPVSNGVTTSESVPIDSEAIHETGDVETTDRKGYRRGDNRVLDKQDCSEAQMEAAAGAKKGTLEALVKDAAMSLDPAALCTHVRMTLYVLYVSEVRADWPEHGRARKVFEIDEAIQMLHSRPEFQAVVMEVKERKLHEVMALSGAAPHTEHVAVPD